MVELKMQVKNNPTIKNVGQITSLQSDVYEHQHTHPVMHESICERVCNLRV